MGKRFDQSEMPTVENAPDFSEFEFPEIVLCNVCNKKLLWNMLIENIEPKPAFLSLG